MSVQTDAKPTTPIPSSSAESFLKPVGFSATKRNSRGNIKSVLDYEIRHDRKVTVVSDKKNVEFIERQELLLNELEYPRDGSSQGLVLIFNQESFEDKTYRSGSRRDVNELILCLGRLGFNINENHVFTDFTKKEIETTIDEVTSNEKALMEVNSLIVFFLTHGESFNKLHAKDKFMETNDIWKKFMTCGALRNKPKMFIFQACKGDRFSTTGEKLTKQIDLVPETTFKSNFIGPDMLVVYSTTEGNVSFRDPITGTWFIQELCKNLTAYGRRDDMVSIIIRTTKCICRNYYVSDGANIKKQMPLFISTLRKKFYLNRNKDRSLLIKLIQDQESMKSEIEKLKEDVQKVLEDKEKKNSK